MRELSVALIVATALSAGVAGAQEAAGTEGARAADAEAVELYARALSALLGDPEDAGRVHVAAFLVKPDGRLVTSGTPESVVERLRAAGYPAELAELAENGLWQVPRGRLFVMLRPIEFWPGRKVARLNIGVGSGVKDIQEVAFTFKNEGEGWVLVEKGPAGDEG